MTVPLTTAPNPDHYAVYNGVKYWILTGMYRSFYLLEAPMPDDNDSRSSIWDDACISRGPKTNVFFSQGSMAGRSLNGPRGGGFQQSPIECRLTHAQYLASWARVGSNGSPPNFLLNPTGWIQFELRLIVGKMMHWWFEVDDPFAAGGNYGPGGAHDASAVQDNLRTATLTLVGILAVMSLLVVAARLAIQRNAAPAADAARGMLTLVVVSAIGFTVVQVLLQAGDAFSRHIILSGLAPPHTGPYANGNEKVVGPGYCSLVDNSLANIAPTLDHMNFFLFLIVAILLIISSVVLFLYMLGRVFVITLLTGLLPLSAAATATYAGRQWFARSTTHLLAFILVKPAATVVFVVAVNLSQNTTNTDPNASDQLISVFMLMLGTLLLPSMTRLAFPMVSAAAQGDSVGPAMLIGTAAMGAKTVRSGVAAVTRR